MPNQQARRENTHSVSADDGRINNTRRTVYVPSETSQMFPPSHITGSTSAAAPEAVDIGL